MKRRPQAFRRRCQLAATGLGCGGGRTLPVCALGIASWPPYGLVVTPGLVARILLDVETVAVLVLVATVGLVVWWAAGRSGGARRSERRWCTNRNWHATVPTTGASLTDGVGSWAAHVGHRIQHIARELRFDRSPTRVCARPCVSR